MGQAVTVDEKVRRIIIETLNVSEDEVKNDDASFVDDLGADSLDTVEVVMKLEDAFDIDIPDEEAEKIKTVGEAITHIKKHIKQTETN